ncbi:hypothetical protein ADUPG1_013319 [Aduncisulcus paluster]|uniref:BAR domain-containing protein n=1 Tax=Aduncisulcus paluster TaxID=2918883 RepID=A0ABQ5K329_9EUKA|nr:hypothetical protein ADUPG1_013319 [Aduncisulcus paluster]
MSSFFRQVKQATLQKFKAASKETEPVEFRNAVDRFRTLQPLIADYSAKIEMCLAKETQTSATSAQSLSEISTTTSAVFEDGSFLKSSLEAIAEVEEKLVVFKREFFTKYEEGMRKKFSEVQAQVDEIAGLKKKYNKIRLEHDSLSRDRDICVTKGKTDKAAQITTKFDPIHEEYVGMQVEYISKVHDLDEHLSGHFALQLVRMMQDYYALAGQSYRILHESQTTFNRLESKLLEQNTRILREKKEAEKKKKMEIEAASVVPTVTQPDVAELVAGTSIEETISPTVDDSLI